jgi:type IV pilus assembly protein PilQ
MRNTDVSAILHALARAAGQNIMMNDGVTGITNVNVKNAPWDQVFRGVLRTNGLAFSWEGDIIRVMTLKDMERDRDLEDILQKQKVQRMASKRLEPLLTRVMLIEYADAKELAENLKELLTERDKSESDDLPRGSVKVDEHNNALILHATRDYIATMTALIEELDRPTPQVLIEANIVEATKETARQLGVQWGGLYRSGNTWVTPGANTGNTSDSSLNDRLDPTAGVAGNFPANLADDVGLTIGILNQNLGDFLLNVQLSALEEEGKLNILSSPAITTVDNQKAVIESGTEVPYQTVSGLGASSEVSIEYKKAVLRLEVTPHVIDARLLKMQIIINDDEVDFSREVDGNPTIITKKTENTVILYDGQTTVIGGLTKERSIGTEDGVPTLKDIPLLGYLFKREGKSDLKQELLIFITPHILKERGPVQEPAPEKHTNETPTSPKE